MLSGKSLTNFLKKKQKGKMHEKSLLKTPKMIVRYINLQMNHLYCKIMSLAGSMMNTAQLDKR